MIKKKEINELKKRIPKGSSYMRRIADMTQLGRTTIHKFFKHQTIKYDNAELIYDAALEIVVGDEKRKARREERQKFLREATNQ